MSMGINPEDKPQKIAFGLTDEVNEEQRKMLQSLVEMMGVKELSARMDRQEQINEALTNKVSEVVNSLNNLITSLQGQGQASTTFTGSATQPSQMDKIEALGKLVTSLEPLIDKYFRPQQAPQGILSAEYINEQLANSAKSNFELGGAIIDTLKNKIVNKSLTKIVTDIVHEPL